MQKNWQSVVTLYNMKSAHHNTTNIISEKGIIMAFLFSFCILRIIGITYARNDLCLCKKQTQIFINCFIFRNVWDNAFWTNALKSSKIFDASQKIFTTKDFGDQSQDCVGPKSVSANLSWILNPENLSWSHDCSGCRLSLLYITV